MKWRRSASRWRTRNAPRRFWVETLGFELSQDAPTGAERWLEVRTPDKAVVVVLELREGLRPAAPYPGLPTSNVSFYAEDLQRAYQELRARGVRSPHHRPAGHERGRQMRKVVAGLFQTLDGIVGSPETWQPTYFNDEMGREMHAQAAAADTILLGRRPALEKVRKPWPR